MDKKTTKKLVLKRGPIQGGFAGEVCKDLFSILAIEVAAGWLNVLTLCATPPNPPSWAVILQEKAL